MIKISTSFLMFNNIVTFLYKYTREWNRRNVMSLGTVKPCTLTETVQPLPHTQHWLVLDCTWIFQQSSQINSCFCLYCVCCVARPSPNILMLNALTVYWIDVRIPFGKQHVNKCWWRNNHTHTYSHTLSLSFCLFLFIWVFCSSSLLLLSLCLLNLSSLDQYMWGQTFSVVVQISS